MNLEIQQKKEKGITLIALVITIIVLLILAGVVIATITGDNGLLQKATDAKIETIEAEGLERIKLAVMASRDENGINTTSLVKNLSQINGLTDANNLEILENTAITLPKSVKLNNTKYEIKEDGTVEKILLPKEYQQVEYIESSGIQYINTGILAKKNIQIETEIEVTTKQQDTTVFGYYNDYTSFNSNGDYYHLTPYSNKWYFGKNGIEGSANIYKDAIGMKYNIIFNDINGAIIINNEILCTNEIFEAPDDTNIAISKRGSNANHRNGKFKYFYFNVFDKDENKVIREFLPCYATTTVTDVDGEQCLAGTVGLYDTVNGQFYTNQGTGTFGYGMEDGTYVAPTNN